jgi:hypothetical protein
MIKVLAGIIFATDTRRTREHYGQEQLTAEHDGRFFRISIDRSMLPPFYELYEEYEQDGRLLNNRLFASSKLQKIEDYIKDNVI